MSSLLCSCEGRCAWGMDLIKCRHCRGAVSTAYFFDALGERSFFFIVFGLGPFWALAMPRVALAIFSFGGNARTFVIRLFHLHDGKGMYFLTSIQSSALPI